MTRPLARRIAVAALAVGCAVLPVAVASAQTGAQAPAKAARAAKLAAPKAAAATACASCVPDTLGRIRAQRRINVAFSGDSRPFSFVGPDRQPAGYSIDLCRRVIAEIGRAAGVPDLGVGWIVGTAQERVAMVASGKAELDCANTTATQARMVDVDFSNLVFVDAGGFLVRADAPLQRIADLAGRRIGVIGGTTTEARLAAALKDRRIEARITTLRDGTEGVAMLESGSLDAFASDKIKLVGLAAQGKSPGALALLAEDLSYEPLAFALPRGDSAFRLVVNRALTQVYASGEIDRIFEQWLGTLGRPSTLLSATYLLNAIPE